MRNYMKDLYKWEKEIVGKEKNAKKEARRRMK